MSVIKSFAHRAHQALSPLAPRSFKRSHVYELIAAALGFKSWASFHESNVLFDSDKPEAPANFAQNIIARALQVGCSQTEALALAGHFQKLYAQQPFSSVPLRELDERLFDSPADPDQTDTYDDSDFEDDEDWLDEDESEPVEHTPPRTSEMLRADLEDRAEHGDMLSHYRLAKLLECNVPTDYLYQESLRGRVLTVQEQRWVDEYLALREQHVRYLKHLLAAADAGLRAAALDYSMVTGNTEYRLRAEAMEGNVDPRLMAASAPDWPTRREWLWRLVDLGDESALNLLAEEGDQNAGAELTARETAKAVAGDAALLRGFAEEALREGDVIGTWKWQFVALSYGVDLTTSSMHAYHEEGPHAGEFYDSDFGGPMYASGDEGLQLPEVTEEETKTARIMATRLLSEASRSAL
jgi:hypothetical protein